MPRQGAVPGVASHLAHLGLGGPIESHVAVAVQVHEVLQNVQHLGHLFQPGNARSLQSTGAASARGINSSSR